MKRVSLAIVGAGEFGQRYIETLRNLSGVDIRWICDRNQNKADAVARSIHGAEACTDIKTVCEDDNVDAVIVVTPENAHRVVAEPALNAGKHVIVEKPLATSDEDATAIIAAATRSNSLLMTSFLLRFDYRYARLQQRLAEIGTIRNVYAYRNFDRRLFEQYSRTHSFVENAIHDIDLVLWYVQDEVTAAHGFCRNTQGRENPDVNWGILEFSRGAIGAVQTSWLYPPQQHDLLQWNAGIQVMGDRGVLEVRFDADGFRANTETTGSVVLDQSGWATIHNESRGAFGAMVRHYVSCLRGESQYHGTSPQEAVRSMQLAVRLAEDAAARPAWPASSVQTGSKL